MRVIEARNVNDAYRQGVEMLRREGVRGESRAGDVLVMPTPVTTVYERPYERVLFDPARDANPFFHFMESLWMLAGRNDAAFLNQFVKDFGSRYAEEDGLIWGGYGRRWRGWFNGLDQLDYVVGALRNNPDDRRVVIQMWDAEKDLGADKRDVPCNTQVYPRVRQGYLDITVCCRSNDIIWGAYGANAVHFSVLQEYLAARISVGVGRMYQISNNYHAYLKIIESVGLPTRNCPYQTSLVTIKPMVENYQIFDDELSLWMKDPRGNFHYENSVFPRLATPMFLAYHAWRNKDAEKALDEVTDIEAGDWRVACERWITRRMK